MKQIPDWVIYVGFWIFAVIVISWVYKDFWMPA